MNKPKLVIMAAGMGSRYGGLKQIDPIDEYGHIIMDFSIFDAKEAGFEDIIFIIKKENENEFKETIGLRIENEMKVTYVYQDLSNLPNGFKIPENRVKPWGTGHAIFCCANVIDGPFAVINADDFYGRRAFQQIYDYLISHKDDDKYRYAMVGYLLKNTITENGYVSRGVCTVNEEGYLLDIEEKTQISQQGNEIVSLEGTSSFEILPQESMVSMNLWGFSESIMKELKEGFGKFLEGSMQDNPLKSEYYIPFAVDSLLQDKKATVKVLTSYDKWYGVTYKEDKPVIVKSVLEMKKQGDYPKQLWESKE